MPSKQRIAYQWALDNVLSILIGETTSLRNQMIASDDELALVDAIKLAINSPDGSLRNSKFCKDYYHLVTKQWIAIVKTTRIKDIANCSDISDFIGQWIKSWFNYVNDEDELMPSIALLAVPLPQSWIVLLTSASEVALWFEWTMKKPSKDSY